MRTLQVSRSTARFIKLGHPWVRIDRFTKGLNALQCGETINLVDERGQQLASALADPDQDICARVYHRRPGKTFDIAQALDAAKKRRQALVDDPETNCYRLVHGESDFLPALRIEVLGDYFVILMRAPCIREHLSEILKWAHSSYPQLSIVIKEQFEDLRRHPLRILDAAVEKSEPSKSLSNVWGIVSGASRSALMRKVKESIMKAASVPKYSTTTPPSIAPKQSAVDHDAASKALAVAN